MAGVALPEVDFIVGAMFSARRQVDNRYLSTHLRENPLALATGRKAGSCFRLRLHYTD